MLSELDPILTTDNLRGAYLRYLRTIYPLENAELRAQFWRGLEEPDRLTKGPLLEAAPPFRTGRSVGQLASAGILHRNFPLLASDALPLDRPLYVHQEKAIVKSVQHNRNLVVATGTGSGKTEAFLLPILDHCLREREQGTLAQPGVRALLLYPMNALANDQMKRLRRLLAGFPAITFGRYTGETIEDASDAEDLFIKQFPNEPRLVNELLSREEMRAQPPHILLTNYAMLEYLLLRPQDSEFFDGLHADRWRFIVLDEAHTYDGATGIEIAMLIRRLKDRIVTSQPGRLRCIATSATLGSKDDYPGITEFASNLFSEPFEWQADNAERQDVIAAERVPLSALGEPWGTGKAEAYAEMASLLLLAEAPAAGPAQMQQAARNLGVPVAVLDQAGPAPERFLYEILKGDARVQQLRELFADNQPQFFRELAETVFPGQADGSRLLAALVSLAVRARPDSDSLSLLPARYHLFARALEGAFVCLRDHADSVSPQGAGLRHPHIFLTRHQLCPECEKRQRQGQVFELAACTRCGKEYLVGRIVEAGQQGLFAATNGPAQLKQLVVDNSEARGEKAYLLLDDQSSLVDEDEEAALGEAEAPELDGIPYVLCGACGAIAPNAGGAFHCLCPSGQSVPIHVIRIDLKNHTELHYCASCGSRSTGEIVYRFLPGQDAPVSVLATALYQQIPPVLSALDKPGQGRKLLIFSDSRQDAAFFASYMDRTYDTLLRRRLIVKTLVEEPDAPTGKLRLRDLVSPVLTRAEAAGVFAQSQSFVEQKQKIWTWLMQEFLALDRRISPEGVGLLGFRIVKPKGWQPLASLSAEPWHLTTEEQWILLQVLLDSLRQQGVVVFPDGLSPKNNDDFAPRARELFMRGNDSDSKLGILSWSPLKGSNRRLDFLLRLLSARAPHLSDDERMQHAKTALNAIWKSHLTAPNSVWREHLPLLSLGQAAGVVYRVDHAFWEVVPTVTAELQTKYWRKCQQCGALTLLDLGICPTYRCGGQVAAVDPFDAQQRENHYRQLYTHLEPISFTISEHTAQWKSTEAAAIQEQFVQGDINALSCSTTFELGVDVGELQVVLMRNVPPTTANYVQRAGRAGRRTDSTAFAVTFAQRRSHDLTQYSDPRRIVAGKIHPPTFVIANEKIVRRHAHSVALAKFLRVARDNDGSEFKNVGAFFEPSDGKLTGANQLRAYLAAHPADLQQALLRVIPQTLQAELAIESWGWLNGLSDETGGGVLDNAEREVDTDLKTFEALMNEAVASKKGYDLERYKRILATLRARDLLGFLGSRNVLPKYGFPVDVVELKTDHLQYEVARKLELQRDLRIALSEYAPGGEIVAAKHVWVSGGLYQRPDKAWPEYFYAICPECGRFNKSAAPLDGLCKTCGGALSHAKWGAKGQYLMPIFGFVADADKTRDPGEARPQRLYSSRVFFSDYSGTAPDLTLAGDLSLGAAFTIGKRYSRQGQLAIINSGPQGSGFRICQTCGRGVLPPPKEAKQKPKYAHTNPRTGRTCNGTLVPRHLGHEFQTDVLELQMVGSLCRGHDDGFWLSLLYALMEGASEALSIQRDDLDGCLSRYDLLQPPGLMLFDNVPGGAGHVSRVAANLKAVMVAALERVKHCECGPETSCYECLRNYWNQPYHEKLSRGPVATFLSQCLQAE